MAPAHSGRLSKSRKSYSRIRAADLNVDASLQRTFDPSLAAKIETGWNPREIGTIVVSQRADGTYWICDGQHRQVVARRIEGDDYMMDCEVHTELSRRDEARKYLIMNRQRKSPRPFDNYKVAIAAGESLETRIASELADVGLEMAHSPSAHKVSAVETVRRVAKRDKLKSGLVRDTFTVVTRAWGHVPDAYDGNIVEGVARLIDSNRRIIDVDRLVAKLGKKPPMMWKQQAMIYTVGGGGSESRSNAVTEVMRQEYNKGLRTAANLLVGVSSSGGRRTV